MGIGGFRLDALIKYPKTPKSNLLMLSLKPKPPLSIMNNKRRRIPIQSTTPPQTLASSQKPKTLLLDWVPLNLTQSELSLPLTFPTGQTFRWRQTAPLQFTGVVGPHLLSLRQHLPDGHVSYHLHNPSPPQSDSSAAEPALLDFLNTGISLAGIWEVFSVSDPRFAELATRLAGARVLRQDPLECLVQFLCSSNNNIARITKMVDFVSSLGTRLGSVEGFEFHEFPRLDRLGMVTEQELREAGFGYRAKYLIGTVKALQAKPGGGEEWLLSLRKLGLEEVIEALTTLPGVGPKVAACIALFSLDQHDAVPVDTHVWKIATRDLIPELAGARLTPKLCSRVAEAFVSKYGKYAGWAQTLLFVAELPLQKALLSPRVSDVKESKPSKGKGRGRKIVVDVIDSE